MDSKNFFIGSFTCDFVRWRRICCRSYDDIRRKDFRALWRKVFEEDVLTTIRFQQAITGINSNVPLWSWSKVGCVYFVNQWEFALVCKLHQSTICSLWTLSGLPKLPSGATLVIYLWLHHSKRQYLSRDTDQPRHQGFAIFIGLYSAGSIRRHDK